MAKKKGLAAHKKSKRTKKNNSIVSAKGNPPHMTDLVEFVIPGFAGYAGTRFASRIVHGMVMKKFPKLAKHASVISTFASAGAAWFLVHRIERVRQYHTPVVVGAGIAAIQTAVQAYLPKYGWMVSDHNIQAQTSEQAAAPAPGRAQTTVPSSRGTAALPPPIPSLTATEIVDELEDLDMGTLSSGFSLDGALDMSDAEMDDILVN